MSEERAIIPVPNSSLTDAALHAEPAAEKTTHHLPSISSGFGPGAHPGPLIDEQTGRLPSLSSLLSTALPSGCAVDAQTDHVTAMGSERSATLGSSSPTEYQTNTQSPIDTLSSGSARLGPAVNEHMIQLPPIRPLSNAAPGQSSAVRDQPYSARLSLAVDKQRDRLPSISHLLPATSRSQSSLNEQVVPLPPIGTLLSAVPHPCPACNGQTARLPPISSLLCGAQVDAREVVARLEAPLVGLPHDTRMHMARFL
ncbi:hypothetical protein Tdes44962_MAKER07720 [Teratosphaeria destructans]|uniref:Uncharacterized protein n=1 Tax=Teratosphaeria destructans TaxID=418781 RepID=A0A9W7W5D8_9PEZI|nr:hypothetical protein Tdes44962_MAKER07720 [Teratosphaeria destructans]